MSQTTTPVITIKENAKRYFLFPISKSTYTMYTATIKMRKVLLYVNSPNAEKIIDSVMNGACSISFLKRRLINKARATINNAI